MVTTVLALAYGCATEPVVTTVIPPLTEEGAQLLNRLAGTWSLQINVSGDCPPEWRRPLPAGKVSFSAKDGSLSISAIESASSLFTLFPVDGASLMYSTTASVAGCNAKEIAQFTVDALSVSSGAGTLQVDIERDTSSACKAFLDTTDVPEACTTMTIWQGIRLSPAINR